MQELRWKEPVIVSEIEKRRALEKRPQRVRGAVCSALAMLTFYALLICAMVAFAHLRGGAYFPWSSLVWLPFFVMGHFLSAWNGTPEVATELRITKLGVTRMNTGKHIPWRDITAYRFESDERAPNLRVLIVEARGRKAPLRLYFEGDEREARLRDTMAQGLASTRKTLSQGQQLST